MIVDMEDVETVVDLRNLNGSRKSIYDVFWQECSKYIQEGVGQAVDDRRHQEVTHLATAISVPDLISQVSRQCPEGTPIPSASWVCLQFWPKNHHWHSSCHYTSKLNVKYMVQTRQLRKSHEDSHYAAALFRYQQEMAVKFRQHSAFICLDDKHRVSVGEPGYPVAAVDRIRTQVGISTVCWCCGQHTHTNRVSRELPCGLSQPERVALSDYAGCS